MTLMVTMKIKKTKEKSPGEKGQPAAPAADEKLQKILARYGLGSRRLMETWIQEGRVKVNGKNATLGDRVGTGAKIQVDGKILNRGPLRRVGSSRVLIYYKPEGEVCTRNDPEGRPTVFERLPPLSQSRWVAVGRLDVNTSGLLLFTNDGDIANRLMHPSHEIEREYAVRVIGTLTPEHLAQLEKGMALEDGWAKFQQVQLAGGKGVNHWYHVVIKEGRNREVRRMFEALNYGVSRLIRVRYGDIALPRHLKRGQWELLEPKAWQELPMFKVADK